MTILGNPAVYQLARANPGHEILVPESDVSEWKDERRRRREVAIPS